MSERKMKEQIKSEMAAHNINIVSLRQAMEYLCDEHERHSQALRDIANGDKYPRATAIQALQEAEG